MNSSNVFTKGSAAGTFRAIAAPNRGREARLLFGRSDGKRGTYDTHGPF